MSSRILSIARDDARGLLSIVWANQTKSTFAYVWLRDNCPDPQTFNLGVNTRARQLLARQLDVNTAPTSVEVSADGSGLLVDWPAMRDVPSVSQALYSHKWLLERDLSNKEMRENRASTYHSVVPTVTWDRPTIEKALMRVNMEEVMTDDKVTHDFLESFLKHGLIIIEGARDDETELDRLSTRLGYMLMNSHYGRTFQVKSSPTPGNLAYTTLELGLHTDLPYNHAAPDIQALHADGGGGSCFADAFYALGLMKESHPHLYEILERVPVEFLDDGNVDYHFINAARRPMIEKNDKGDLHAVYFNNQQRSWFVDLPPEEQRSYYEALSVFNEYLYKNLFEIKLSAGSIVIFGNNRVMHGRSSFTTNIAQSRHLVGCYFTFDVFKSKLRVLKRQLGIDEVITV